MGEENRMTVYVIQEMPYKDILSAEEYGKLVPLIPPGFQLLLSSDSVVQQLQDGLKDFSKDDYLLLIGDPSIIGIACSVASDINMGYYKVLKWDRKREKYHPIEIDIRRNKNDENKL